MFDFDFDFAGKLKLGQSDRARYNVPKCAAFVTKFQILIERGIFVVLRDDATSDFSRQEL